MAENKPKWLKFFFQSAQIVKKIPERAKFLFFRTKLGFKKHKYNPVFRLFRKNAKTHIK